MSSILQTARFNNQTVREVAKEESMRMEGLAAKRRYGVFQINSQWMLCCEERHLGRFRDQPAAINAGKRAACQAMGSGFDAELLIMDIGGELTRVDPKLFGH